MIGTIKGKSQPGRPASRGRGRGSESGNWGGSFLGDTQGGKNVKEAQKLVAWLTAPEQQAKLFAVQGSFPSARPPTSFPG